MKTRLIVVLAAVLGILGAAFALEPTTIQGDLYRTPSAEALPGTFYRGTSVRMTNFQAWADAEGVAIQDLTGIDVIVRIGGDVQSQAVTGTVYNATGGLFTATFTIATNATTEQGIEVELIDTNTVPNVSFIYPRIPFITTGRLGE